MACPTKKWSTWDTCKISEKLINYKTKKGVLHNTKYNDQKKKTKQQTMLYKAHHRKLEIQQHEPY
jgi:hypothetical protein